MKHKNTHKFTDWKRSETNEHKHLIFSQRPLSKSSRHSRAMTPNYTNLDWHINKGYIVSTERRKVDPRRSIS